MGSHFYAAGGSSMHVVLAFGLMLVAASVRFASRPGAARQRLAAWLAVVTTGAGLFGTVAGICISARALSEVEPSEQLQVFALGIEESLHNLVLALILVIAAALIAAVGAFRALERAETSAVHPDE